MLVSWASNFSSRIAMFNHKPFPIRLLPSLLIVCTFSISVCLAAPQIYHQSDLYLQGLVQGDEDFVVPREMSRRSILDSNAAESVQNTSLILAQKRTHRKDPLDDFKYYKGGWNISNKHYIFSVAYTAIPLIVITIIWICGFAVTVLIIFIRLCCCHLNRHDYSRTAYAVSISFLIFFTVAAIVGCIVLYTGEENFHGSATRTLDYVVKEADATVDNLTTVSEYLSTAKGDGVDGIFLPPTIQKSIERVQNMVDSAATTLQNVTGKNSDKLRDLLDSVRVALITVSAVMLLLVLLGFLFSVLGLQVPVYILATIGWILSTISLVLCCIFLILHIVTADTCVAMDEWAKNPQAHTALDDILPCVDQATSKETLSQTKAVTFRLVRLVNFFITNVSNIDPPSNLPPDRGGITIRRYYNQSGPPVPVLCNPYNPDMTDRACSPGEVDLINASQEWSNYVCQVSDNDTCTTTGRLTPKFFNQMTSIASVGVVLHHYGPFLVELVDCTFVRETFGDIIEYHCPGLKRYSGWIFVGLVMVSAAVMLSLILWMFYTGESRNRKNAKQFQAISSRDSKNPEEVISQPSQPSGSEVPMVKSSPEESTIH